MSNQRLWAPWRYDYVSGQLPIDDQLQPEPQEWLPLADRDCFLCQAAATYENPRVADRANLVIERGKHGLVILNRFPYNNGHLLVAPHRHVGPLHELTDEEKLAGIELLTRYTQLLTDKISAQGFNIGLTLGDVAGAGVPGHLHWHLVPRWSGDHNFMPVTGATSMIHQSLESLWDLLTG